MSALEKLIEFKNQNPEIQKFGIDVREGGEFVAHVYVIKDYISGCGATEDSAADLVIVRAANAIATIKATPPEPHTTITAEDIASWHGHNSSEYVATLQEILTGKYSLDDVRKDILEYRG